VCGGLGVWVLVCFSNMKHGISSLTPALVLMAALHQGVFAEAKLDSLLVDRG
jgi:hypothetical protein